jgi:aspartate-semialdehyde dehydrogenase
MKNGLNVAIVGATGAVGEEMIAVLADSDLVINLLRPMSSKRSAGQTVSFRSDSIEVVETNLDAFEGIDVALFSAGSEVSLELGRALAEKGITVIDNSRAFRMDSDVPLVVPEVNPEAITSDHFLIANPNCSTIQLVVALEAARKVAPLKRVSTSTYQSASGGGRAAMDELRDQTIDLLNFRAPKVEHFSRRLAFDVLPQIDAFAEDGFTLEEHKMINETRKILGNPSLPVCATCVRVPVFVGHALSLNIEFTSSFEFEKLITAMKTQQGLIFHEAAEEFPTTADVTGSDDVLVGRLRQDPSVDDGVVMWVVADNLRKGAATNAVQILQLLQTEGRWK